MLRRISCDIFCAVIDNLGDAGVCWRLARQLATEHDWQVRLWIDDPAPIALLAPDHAALPISICTWDGDIAAIRPAQVVVEAFACTLPPRYVEAMAALPRAPVWLNLEYLSAEDWVEGCHGLPSPQPPLIKHFFFPGLSGTGGLIREGNLPVPPAPTFRETLQVSLFCYDNPQLPTLLDVWRESVEPIVCHVTEGLPRQQVESWLGQSFPPGSITRRGNLQLNALPFLPQTEYDALLRRCHINFVRGEDSLVRAQWAERPFVWQAYPQTESAHITKLLAWLKHYREDLDAEPAAAVSDFWLAWNSAGDVASAWPALRHALPALATHAPHWAQRLAAPGDLARNLAKFCLARL